ncbi:glycosyltransferase family 2 protein [Aquirufa aurantiipilula]|uniref:Glycosyltransferase family 2 protein n=1 Tax=Aquirufa aurantiipilula TaxID=2696561 RepID=A0ABT6BGY0_9BACT|nr:glycosyltransferase family 2 protein [Aquirufa aurantiipilula]MDF5689720.1 glycosyltransferase family 2 protein [Aquirufa aurantiipilula]
MSLELVVVIPAYNEEECIQQVVAHWINGISTFVSPDKFKLLIINDGSKDRTGAILDEISGIYPNLIAKHQLNGGHGNAVVNGYRMAVEMNPTYVFQTDSDDQFDVKDFGNFWEKRNQSEFILGYRKVRHDDPFRLVITRILKFSLLFIYGTYIDDANIPFRLFKTSFLKKLLHALPAHTPFAPNIFLAVLAKKSGQNLFNIPVIHRERETGEVSIRHFKLLKVCWQSFKELLAFRVHLNSLVKEITQGK